MSHKTDRAIGIEIQKSAMKRFDNELRKTLKDAIEQFEDMINDPDKVLNIESTFEQKYIKQIREELQRELIDGR